MVGIDNPENFIQMLSELGRNPIHAGGGLRSVP